MKTQNSNKEVQNDFLYDDLDEETLLEIDNSISSQQEDEDEDEDRQRNQEDYKSITSDDSVKIYLQQIGKIPLLSFEDELEIARQIKENHSTKAREILINANLRKRPIFSWFNSRRQLRAYESSRKIWLFKRL